MMYYDYMPTVSSFIATMAAHGIRCVQVSREKFAVEFYRATSSFTESHHDAERGVFYYTDKVKVKDLTHEIGHLVAWDLIGRPARNNFGMDVGRSFSRDDLCRELITKLVGSVNDPFGSTVDYNEVAACAVEAAINCRHRGRSAAVKQLREQEFTTFTGARRPKTSAVVDGMLIIGETLIEAHRQRHLKTT